MSIYELITNQEVFVIGVYKQPRQQSTPREFFAIYCYTCVYANIFCKGLAEIFSYLSVIKSIAKNSLGVLSLQKRRI
jgi:hypothetical protein